MEIKCIFDSKKFSAKPQGYEVGNIINRMTLDKINEYSLEEIKNNLINGKTVRPSYCGGKESEWQSQQIFMIDIDDNLTIESAIDLCKKKDLLPNFIYTSFSHKEEHHKFRLVFILDKEITDFNIAKKIQLYLMDALKYADEHCKNLNRIYYSGKSIVFDGGNVLSSDRLVGLSVPLNLKVTENRKLTSKKVEIIKQKGNIDCIKTLDVKGLQGSLRKGRIIDKDYIPSSIILPKTPLQIVTNRAELYNAIGAIDLVDFLGLDCYC